MTRSALAAARADQVVAPTQAPLAAPFPNPPGGALACVGAASLNGRERIVRRMTRRFGPDRTDPGLESARRTTIAAEVPGSRATTMWGSGPDARRFRMAGLPAVVHGPAPHAMGGAEGRVRGDASRRAAPVPAPAAPDALAAEP